MTRKTRADRQQKEYDREREIEALAVVSKLLEVLEVKRSIAQSLKNQLKQAERAVEEAEWDVNARIRAMATRLRAKPSKSDGRANGSAS